MGRDYSKKACFTCKQRRKKCDEGTPTCGACRRLNLPCVYSSSNSYREKPRGATNLGALKVRSPLVEVQTLHTGAISSNAERAVFEKLDPMVLTFFSPASKDSTRDLQILWQMAFSNVLVRSSLIACFARLVGDTDEYKELDCLAYGRTLRLLRDGLGTDELGQETILSTQIAVVFVGLKESVGAETLVDPLQHWVGLSALVGRMKPIDVRKWSALPINIYLMVLEAVVYHLASFAPFSKILVSAYKTYRKSGLYEKLCEANPIGEHRISLSPLIGGQYAMYDMGLRILALHRMVASGSVDEPEVDELELALRLQRLNLTDEFEISADRGRGVRYHDAVHERYRMLCDVLLLCVIALREPTALNVKEFDKIVSENLAKFWDMPILDMTYAPSTWPLQILACGIRDDADFEKYNERFAIFQTCLDPGHMTRSVAFLNALAKERASAKRAVASGSTEVSLSQFPAGMSILRKQDGVLS